MQTAPRIRMREIRLYCREKPAVGTTVRLDRGSRCHAEKVLRLQAGAAVTLVHGDGQDYFAEVKEIAKTRFSLLVHAKRRNPAIPGTPLVLGIALLKGDPMDRVLQKSVELGVSKIVPLHTRYSERKLDVTRWQKKTRHWQGILRASALQCGRAEWPELAVPTAFSELLTMPAEERWIFSPAHSSPSSSYSERRHASSLILLVGPEGGFSAQESAAALAAGWRKQSLGKRILRADTAAIAALIKAAIVRGEIPC